MNVKGLCEQRGEAGDQMDEKKQNTQEREVESGHQEKIDYCAGNEQIQLPLLFHMNDVLDVIVIFNEKHYWQLQLLPCKICKLVRKGGNEK